MELIEKQHLSGAMNNTRWNALLNDLNDIEEMISYRMPAFKYNGMLVYFAAYKNHIGFYPGASSIVAFKKELSVYKGAKGSVQFPLNKPLPLRLIGKETNAL